MLGPKVAFELLKAIDQLSNKGVAPWVATYLYTLRVFGNLAAHDKWLSPQYPRGIEPSDSTFRRDFSSGALILDKMLSPET